MGTHNEAIITHRALQDTLTLNYDSLENGRRGIEEDCLRGADHCKLTLGGRRIATPGPWRRPKVYKLKVNVRILCEANVDHEDRDESAHSRVGIGASGALDGGSVGGHHVTGRAGDGDRG